MSQVKNLDSRSLIELKATAYDIISTIEYYQSLLAGLNKEIKLRNDQEQKTKIPQGLIRRPENENPS